MIQIVNLTKEYRAGIHKTLALNNVTISIQDKQFTIITGPSGSGKTTLLNMIGAIDQPTRGNVIIDGKNIRKLSEESVSEYRNKNIGYIFQRFFLDEDLDVLKNICMPLIIRGIPYNERDELARDCLAKVGLASKEKESVRSLSGGEKQRIAIARALVSGAKYILADEPTANLDSKTGQDIMTLLKKSVSEMGKTVVMTTHNPNYLIFADCVISMKDGGLNNAEQ